jgi:multisubunit Na+/H+ antiporter MnhB subunit
MSELVSEALLRLAKVLAAVVIGLVVYVVATGPLGAPGSPELALVAFVAGGVTVLLLESSPI